MKTVIIIIGICVAVAIAYYVWNNNGYNNNNTRRTDKFCASECHKALDRCLDDQGAQGSDHCAKRFVECKSNCG